MRYLPFRPLFSRSWMRPWDEDEESWLTLPEMNTGLNVYEDDNEVTVEAAVPGIPAEKIKVTYDNGLLRISAHEEEKDKEERSKKGRTVHQWQRSATFDYANYLRRPIDPKTITAETRDGVLMVKAKVAEEAKAKEIPVKVAVK
ncbi:Hsp20/alpha crystallin family protein [Patescibacteria group bacterium]|nr:Hsp20/alpha crystallin family protein [Patescibacteria group bacterium]